MMDSDDSDDLNFTYKDVDFADVTGVYWGKNSKLIKKQLHPRQQKCKKDYHLEFKNKVGSEDAYINIMNEYEKIRNSGKMEIIDGFLASYINAHELSQHCSRTIFGIGGTKWQRIKDGSYLIKKENDHIRYNSVTIPMIYKLMMWYHNLRSEPGFGGCRHRRIQNYINLDNIHNYTQLFAYYKANSTKSNLFNCYNTFYKYSIAYCSDYKFNSLREDCCDTCLKFKIALKEPNLTDGDKDLLTKHLEMHTNESKTQRKEMQKAIMIWGNNNLGINDDRIKKGILKIPCYLDEDPATSAKIKFLQNLEQMNSNTTEDLNNDDIIQCFEKCKLEDIEINNIKFSDFNISKSFIDDSESNQKIEFAIFSDTKREVNLQADDFAGNLVLPYYGKNRPSIDYYLSNLNIYMFVISDLVLDVDFVYCYDERTAGKDGDALCSLRLFHHLEKYESSGQKGLDILFNIFDNCTGQNKSQCIMMFYCFMSLFIYKKIVLHFLVSGHSHMRPDVANSHCKTSLEKMDYYDPNDMVKKFNTIKNVKALFIESNNNIFHSGWKETFGKYFNEIPYLKECKYFNIIEL